MSDIFKDSNISSGFDLLQILKGHFDVGDSNSWWWPSYLSLEVQNGIEVRGARTHSPNVMFCIASILGQNTKYENASSAIYNLYSYLTKVIESRISKNDLEQLNEFKSYKYPNLAFISQSRFCNNIIEIISGMNQSELINLIKSAGFHNQKSQRIILLTKNILQDFGDFESFSENVTREWLLSQKGIGNESASSILNYGLCRAEMVVDKYTQKLLGKLGFEFDDYYEIQNFLSKELEKAKDLYNYDISLAQIMARFHGKIVEYGKKHRI
ncbi:endonuclease III [Helicobacter saguini]|uniref:Endonuclease III n=1 Tax=Helicobacter saguini TaxID=1548018 RepID=A0A347VRA3_9HELI|nr:hypothetical protein [Helicobacter saguini]MWV62978.1 endonuclease III [Helicobacter saguini]MWV66353.1 endonuclease III [Helicobacter saguini]MWV68705.1 endonuclease III [Helicobacter saguini]MWV71744.1 endonuclease III [Helicobacter saguini]TLD91610.1 endonuclease III [Helicobacter saguini]